MRIGVVCEGSNDFLALRALIYQIALARSLEIKAIDAVQPRVDATSEHQIGGGGWPRVKVWLEDNSGADLRKVLRPQIFSASPAYDILIIHLDGDVIWVSNEFDAMVQAKCFQNVEEVVKVVEGYIENKLNIPDDLDDYIIYSVPVMHMETWLVAASKRRPIKRNLEHGRMKGLSHRYLTKRYQLPLKEAAKEAAVRLGDNIDTLRKELVSLNHFAERIDTAI